MNIPEIRVKIIRESGVEYNPGPQINNDKAAVDFLRHLIGDEDREHLVVLLLNQKNKITGYHTVSIGSLSKTVAHPREIFKAAILNNSASIILAHNHPSGDPTPSKEDNDMTDRISKAGEMLGIPLLDHVVIGAGKHYSYQANNQI